MEKSTALLAAKQAQEKAYSSPIVKIKTVAGTGQVNVKWSFGTNGDEKGLNFAKKQDLQEFCTVFEKVSKLIAALPDK